MVLVQGGNLRNALAADTTGEFSWANRGYGVACDIMRGLCHIHASNVIHRWGRYKITSTQPPFSPGVASSCKILLYAQALHPCVRCLLPLRLKGDLADRLMVTHTQSPSHELIKPTQAARHVVASMAAPLFVNRTIIALTCSAARQHFLKVMRERENFCTVMVPIITQSAI